MLREKSIFVIFVLFFISLEVANATTIFARQYETSCNTCHIGVPPTLNTTGKDFFRNGMRFSKDDTTTLQRTLDEEDSFIPIGLYLGLVNKTVEGVKLTPKGEMPIKNDVINPTLTLMAAGSLSENFSLFMGARFAYSKPNPNTEDREFNLIREKVYLQYNQTKTHQFKAGVLLPYPDTSENSGLSDMPDVYISPIDRGNLKPLYGVEYSYMTDNGFTFLVAAGVIGKLNNERSVMGEINYSTEYFSGSAILNNITTIDSESNIAKYTPSEILLGERLSLMLPLEYNFKYAYLNLTGVYENNDRVLSSDYFALESTLTIPMFETAQMRFVHTNDNEHERGYAFKYSHIVYENLFLNLNLAKVEANKADYESISFGASIIY